MNKLEEEQLLQPTFEERLNTVIDNALEIGETCKMTLVKKVDNNRAFYLLFMDGDR